MSEIIAKTQKEQLEEQDRKIQEFSTVLDSLQSLNDKKKILWMHVYENAIRDRTHAQMLFSELYISSKGSAAPSDHHLSGPIMAKYIERMSRANDQLIKLAELIQRAQDEEEEINEDDVFNQILGSSS